MPVEVKWRDENQTVILQIFSGRWTWDEFYEYNSHRIPEMMRQVNHTVHIVSDFTAGQSLPIGGAITHARNVVSHYPDNWGTLIVVSNNMFIQSMVNIFGKVFQTSFGDKVHSAESREEAYAIIESWQKANDSN